MNKEINKQNNKTDSIKKGIVILGIILLIVFGSFFLFNVGLNLLFANMCGNYIVETKFSPNKKHQLLIFQRDCGASTGFSTQISILNKNEKLKNESGNIFIADNNHGEANINDKHIIQIKAKWLNDKTISIEYDGNARTFKMKNSTRGIKVIYKTP